MAALSYMQRRASGTYEFRKRLPEALAGKPVPAHMRGVFSDLINPKTDCFKRELVRSLATKDLKDAKRRDHQEALKATQLFDDAIRALTPSPVAAEPVALDFKLLGDEVFAELLADDEAERIEGDDRRHLQTPEDRTQWPDLVAVPPSTQMGMSPDHGHAYGELLPVFENEFRAAYVRRVISALANETSHSESCFPVASMTIPATRTTQASRKSPNRKTPDRTNRKVRPGKSNLSHTCGSQLPEQAGADRRPAPRANLPTRSKFRTPEAPYKRRRQCRSVYRANIMAA